MRTILVALVLATSVSGALAQGSTEPRARVDVGGGAAFIRVESDSTSGSDQGYGVTLGVLFKNGFLLRFNVATVTSKSADIGDVGFGNDVLSETDKLVLGDFTAGYLWNRAGMVRPYLRAGLAFVYWKAELDSLFSGSFGPNSDVDQVLTYGGGVEVGEKNHIFALDLQKMNKASFDLSGLDVDLNVSAVSLQYRYRF